MPKLIAVYKDSELVECPSTWEHHKGHIGECSVFESESKHPGKKWFYFVYDKGDMHFGYLHCSMGDMIVEEDGSVLVFSTHDKEHVYKIRVGEKMPEDYLPYQVVGHGDNAVLVSSNGIEVAG